MISYAAWLLKSAIWLSGFALVYLIFLRNERYFLLKRIYLLAGILVAFVFPLVTFHYIKVIQPVAQPAMDFSTAAGPVSITSAVPAEFHINYRLILLLVYLSGIFWLAFRALKNYSRLFGTIKNSEPADMGKIRLIRAEKYGSAFSFFNYVFINPSISDKEAEEIMNHEMVHVRQHHWLDLLLVEILRMVQWVNPFAWIYTGFIRLNHEYLADQAALQRTSNPASYRAALMNQLFDSPVISLTNSFNYSLNKKRFDMMKQIFTSPWRKLKVLCVLPVIAVIFYAFATPKYVNPPNDATIKNETVRQPADVRQQVVMQPAVSGIQDTDKNKKPGKVKKSEMPPPPPPKKPGPNDKVIQEKRVDVIMPVSDQKADVRPDQNPPPPPPPQTRIVTPNMPVYLDGEPTDRKVNDIIKELGHNFGTIRVLSSEEGAKKYGEKGSKGVLEVYTMKKALALGMKVKYPRLTPDDYPTFKGGAAESFTDWVLSQVKYPPEAPTKGINGTVRVTYDVTPDGRVVNVNIRESPDQSMGEAVATVIRNSPKWEPAKNTESKDTFPSFISIKFQSPDNISIPIEPFVVVEQQPVYPGGESALLEFLAKNVIYPEAAKRNLISGRVIVRFAVTPEGGVEQISVLKGIDPLLDAEAIRVVSKFPKFQPGYQGGKPVPVWYMVPVTFSPNGQKPVFSSMSENKILRFIAENTSYPQAAKAASDTGSIFIAVKTDKGGAILETQQVDNVDGVAAPVLPQVVIVGYKPTANTGIQGPPVKNGNHEILYNEALRVTKLLPGLGLPECNEKPLEFVIAFKFILK